jgi:hypothetical protein
MFRGGGCKGACQLRESVGPKLVQSGGREAQETENVKLSTIIPGIPWIIQSLRKLNYEAF